MSRLVVALAVLLAPIGTARAHFVFVVPDVDLSGAKVVMSEDLAADDDIEIDIIGGAKLSCRDSAGTETPLLLHKAGHTFAIGMPGNGTRVIHGIC